MRYFDQIRPKIEYKKVLKQRERDGLSFFKKYNKQFIDVSCPACSQEGEYIFNKYGFKHRVCKNCKTIFCSPRPSEELLSIYYTNYKSPKMWTELLLKADKERKSLQYGPRVKKIVSTIKKNGKTQGGIVLDLGAGSGAFSLCIKNTGFFQEVIAMDLSDSCVQVCKSQELTSLKGTITDINEDSVDLICMNDLLEHLFDPFSFLEKCFEVLKNGGYISVATPNGKGFDFKIMKEKTKNITPPEHLNYFNPYSINLILRKAKFRIIFIETPGKLDVEIILKEKKSNYPLKKKNEYIDFLLEQDNEVLENFQKFLSENRLSSHMLILAKKIKE